jgi:hypothetical protein
LRVFALTANLKPYPNDNLVVPPGKFPGRHRTAPEERGPTNPIPDSLRFETLQQQRSNLKIERFVEFKKQPREMVEGRQID